MKFSLSKEESTTSKNLDSKGAPRSKQVKPLGVCGVSKSLSVFQQFLCTVKLQNSNIAVSQVVCFSSRNSLSCFESISSWKKTIYKLWQVFGVTRNLVLSPTILFRRHLFFLTPGQGLAPLNPAASHNCSPAKFSLSLLPVNLGSLHSNRGQTPQRL